MASRFPQVGDTFGPYTISARLGQGQSGVVFLATHDAVAGAAPVALKVIRPRSARQPGFRERFTAAQQVLRDHPVAHAVTVRDVGEHDGFLYLATEVVVGGDLGARLDHTGALPGSLALTLVAQAASAVHEAHERGLVHGDLVPRNVLLGVHDGEPSVVVCDFGITPATDAVGLADYQAPELAEGGEPTVASDVYALGCLLVAAATGTAPYQGTEQEVAEQHRSAPPPRWQETGEAQALLNRVVARAMAKDPADRYPTAAALRAELVPDLPEPDDAPEAGSQEDTAAPGPPTDGTPPDPAPPPPMSTTPSTTPRRRPRRRTLLVLMGTVLLLAAGTAVVVALTRAGHPDRPPRATRTPAGTPRPSASGTPALRTCQEGGRQVPAGEPCGEPSGLAGLRFVFPGITDDCAGSKVGTDQTWQYVCQDGTTRITYSTFRTPALLRTYQDERFSAPPTALLSGLLRFGPQQMADGTSQVSLMYDGTHPFGVDVSATSAQRALQVANGIEVRAPSAFRGD